MEAKSRGEAWESVVGDLRLQRSVEPLEDHRILVRMTFENESEIPLRTRVLEEVPESVDDSTLVTSAGGDPRAWRRMGDWIVHELRVPESERRTTAYFLELGGRAGLSLATPRVERVEPVGGADTSDHRRREGPSDEPSVTSTRRVRAATEASDPAGTDTAVDTLLGALEAAPAEKRQELRAQLGRSPSEVARFEHLQARLDDLAAYVDALEALIDDHGIDVIDEMQDRIGQHEDRTAALDGDVSELQDALDAYRSRIDDRFGSLRADLAERESELDERHEHLEETLAETRSEVESVRTTQREDRQSRARQVGEIDQSLADIEERLDTLQESVVEFETFQDRFTAAFTVEQSSSRQQATSEGIHEPAENP